ncbi:MAG: metallophosphoesterase, partial [Bacteroidales bacterium]
VYDIRISEPIPPSIYEEPSRIFAIGDIHGQYDRMIRMLEKGKVIDSDLNWIWGDGHLVFMGDIFDRGEGVTEAMWLIYKLERQAAESNGKVHLLLGNHEVMILNNDIRYLANKYYCLTSNTGIEYYSLFSNKSVLGRWIRTKNSIEIIGNTMFVHAGISPDVAESGLSVDEINTLMREYLNNPADTSNAEMKNLITGNMGPVWYRGYVKSSGNYDKITQDELDPILQKYNVDHIVIGHTEVDTITILNNQKTIAINIPLADKNIIEQALLIEKGRFTRIASDMTTTALNNRP